jgi:anti-sigma28 factor (negative regulator of flagellin synthesis)
MKIGKVTDLLNSLTKQQNQTAISGKTTEIRSAEQLQSEAAKLSSDFGTGAAERAEKVADLKNQYKKGELKYDSTEVAKAIYRDLLV